MKNIVPIENCLTELQLLRYLHDECTANEVHAIDRHLTHCPMCSDALEGAMLLNTGRLERSLKHLDDKITTHYADKTAFIIEDKPVMTVVKRPKKRGWLWAAASIVVLFAAGTWILTKPFENDMVTPTVANVDSVSQTNKTTPQIQSSSSTDIAQAESLKKEGKTIINNSEFDSKSPVLADNSTTKKDNALNGKADDEGQNSFGVTTASVPQRDVVTTAKPSPAKSVNTEGGAIANEQQRTNADESRLNEVVAEPLKKANSREKQTRQVKPAATPSSVNNYPGAAAQNAMTENQNAAKAKQSSDDGLSDYQLGMQFYTKGQYKEAISQLNRVLAKQSKGELYENATWYLANSYLKTDKKQEARFLLQRVIAEKGKYAQQAAVLLK